MVAVLFLLPRLLPGPATAQEPEVIHVRLAPPPPEETPFFSELPADRAGAKPEKPDALSNVTSSAADRVPGGEDNLPKMQGESDAPTVELKREMKSSSPSAGSPQPSSEAAGLRAAGQKPGSATLVPVPDEEAVLGEAGNSSTDQPGMQHPTGNATILGDVSLNTIAWEYAPWLQRFGNQLMERWYAPPAYTMGVLKEGGWAMIEVEITKSGKLVRLDLLDEQGHPSLTRAAQSALRSMAPIEPLPSDFPEQTLILRLRMIYPARYR